MQNLSNTTNISQMIAYKALYFFFYSERKKVWKHVEKKIEENEIFCNMKFLYEHK